MNPPTIMPHMNAPEPRFSASLPPSTLQLRHKGPGILSMANAGK